MRKLPLAALAGLSALAAATGPAAADPVRLDEAGLGGVAAGADVPSLDMSSLTSNTTTNNTQTSVSSQETLTQMLEGATVNDNFSTAISSDTVSAFGNASATVAGTIASASR
jgi:hypothetical protein